MDPDDIGRFASPERGREYICQNHMQHIGTNITTPPAAGQSTGAARISHANTSRVIEKMPTWPNIAGLLQPCSFSHASEAIRVTKSQSPSATYHERAEERHRNTACAAAVG